MPVILSRTDNTDLSGAVAKAQTLPYRKIIRKKLGRIWEESKLKAQLGFAKGSVSEMNVHTLSVDTVAMDLSHKTAENRYVNINYSAELVS